MDKIKILTVDVETTAQVGYFWGKKFETNIIEVIEPTYILSFAAKWLGGKYIVRGWPDYKGYKKGVKNDKPLLQELYNLLQKANCIVTQNGQAFDSKIILTRFIHHKFPPLPPLKIIDTLTENRKLLQLPSMSLNDVCDYFKLGKKHEHEGFGLWKKCISGDLQAWKRMLKYNKQDVNLTEQLYLLIRPYIKTHPNLGIYTDSLGCSRCGSKSIQWRGYYMNSTTKYRRFSCNLCGGWGQARE